MKLSAPVHILKSRAKELKRSRSITMTEALDEIAQTEGFSSWSLLQAKVRDSIPKKREDILGYLNPGDMMLIASRPGLGKTTFALQILLQAAKENRKCFFFTLEYSHKDVASKVANLDESIGEKHPNLSFDFSDEISSEYVIEQTRSKITEGSLIAIDYLQLLDQKRTNLELQNQVESLKRFANQEKCIVIFISQLDRAFEEKDKARPDLEDVRLPNPLDLSLFNKTMFLHNGKKVFVSPSQFEIS